MVSHSLYSYAYPPVNPFAQKGAIPTGVPGIASTTLRSVVNRTAKQLRQPKQPPASKTAVSQPNSAITRASNPTTTALVLPKAFSPLVVALSATIGAVLGGTVAGISPLGMQVETITSTNSQSGSSQPASSSSVSTPVTSAAGTATPPTEPIRALGYVQPDPNNPRAFYHEATGIAYELNINNNGIYKAVGQVETYNFTYGDHVKKFEQPLPANTSIVQALQDIFQNRNLSAADWRIAYENQLEQRDPTLGNKVIKQASTQIALMHQQLGRLSDLIFTVENGRIVDPLLLVFNDADMTMDKWRTLVAQLSQSYNPRGVFQTLRSVHIPEEQEVNNILAELKKAVTTVSKSASNTATPTVAPVVAKPVVNKTVPTVSTKVLRHYNWMAIIGGALVVGGIGALCGYFLTKPIPDDDDEV